jgi:hypothetical protein
MVGAKERRGRPGGGAEGPPAVRTDTPGRRQSR